MTARAKVRRSARARLTVASDGDATASLVPEDRRADDDEKRRQLIDALAILAAELWLAGRR